VTEDRARQDTIKWENGSPYWGSDSTPISVEELKVVLKIIDSDISGNKAADSLSNLDTKAHKEYTDSLKNILANPEVPIEEMSRDQLIVYNKAYDALEGIDTTYSKIQDLDSSGKRESFTNASGRVDAIDNTKVVSSSSWGNQPIVESFKDLNRPWVDPDNPRLRHSIDKASRAQSGREMDELLYSLSLGVIPKGSGIGRASSEGLTNLSNYAHLWGSDTNELIQEVFWNKLLGATAWTGSYGKREADKTVPMEALGMDFEMDPNSLLYKFFTLDE